MALATRCPHCQTTFKVANDQLKLHAGLVRCGSCQQIFNGVEHLVPADLINSPTSTTTSATSAPTAAPTAATNPATTSAPTPTPAAIAPEKRPSKPASPIPVEINPSATSKPSAAPLPAREDVQTTQATAAQPVRAHPVKALPITDELPPSPVKPLEATAPAAKAQIDEGNDKLDSAPRVWRSSSNDSVSSKPINPPIADSVKAEKTHDSVLGKLTATTSHKHSQPVAHPAPESLPVDDVTNEELSKADEEALLLFQNSSIDTQNRIRERLKALEFEEDLDETPDTVFNSDFEKDRLEPNLWKQSTISEGIEPDTFSLHEDAEGEKIDVPDDSFDEPDFMAQSEKKRKRRRILRVVYACSLLLLVPALALQATYLFRSYIAVSLPASKPYLQTMCDNLGCQINLPAQIDALSLESNELQIELPDQNLFSLGMQIQNRSSYRQQWPNIELILNDKNFRPVIRKVFKPNEYLDERELKQALQNGIPARSDVNVRFHFEIASGKAEGYSVSIFYP